MSKVPAELFIKNLRGGLNDFDNPNALMDDQCTLVENIDFSRSTLGGRRLGSDDIDKSGSTLSGAIIFVFRHTPSNDPTAAEFWAVSTTNFTTTFVINRKTTSWSAITPVDNFTGTWWNIRAISLHGKMFVAYKSAVDRLHVWDGTSWRRTGVAAPAAPSVANQGSGTYPAVIRYYRVRYTEQSGGATLRRSEPSPSTSFTPNGTSLSARVTKPSAVTEGETHWEVEASADNVNFYRIATVVVGTTTYDDTLAPSAYAVSGPLSEDIGDYTNITSFKYLAADEDRLIVAGHWGDAHLRSRVSWTPVFGDVGSGNDERIPLDTNNFVNLDGTENGDITDLAPAPLNGYLYVFKRKAIYKLSRTNNRLRAYDVINVTKSIGALEGSVVMGRDEYGAPCIYFLDADKGPYRITPRGIEACGYDIRGTWSRVNRDVVEIGNRVHAVYHSDLEQVMWALPLDAATVSNVLIVANIREFRSTEQGARRGWSIYNGPLAAGILSACLFSDNIDAGVARSLRYQPFFGKETGTTILRFGTTNQDNGTSFQARLRTKPFTLGSLLTKFGVMAANLMAKVSTGVTIGVTLVRNYGFESLSDNVVLTADGAETRVIKPLSEVTMANVSALQIELGDTAVANVDWELDAIAIKLSQQESQ